ncbi:hypothetical protein [Tenacibaculum caenipelagi]|uniref:Uncharacterized protein n=1 Tax=Tenacibaculum caenipelagi TaxID=1325435 RepID=A0A4R6TB27_9FLAO|nr:hypothetical protein [Tenacibaculum caenipelagi]TDQ22769.1 hypothetical protein DFQ07_2787 [Tenacibaculum caenipelagi]
MKKENIEEWKPFALVFGPKAFKCIYTGERNIQYYSRSWFCNETGNIHHSEKSVLNCVHCSKKYYKPNKQ